MISVVYVNRHLGYESFSTLILVHSSLTDLGIKVFAHHKSHIDIGWLTNMKNAYIIGHSLINRFLKGSFGCL